MIQQDELLRCFEDNLLKNVQERRVLTKISGSKEFLCTDEKIRTTKVGRLVKRVAAQEQ